MNDDYNGWGNSTVATKYIYEYIHTVLDLDGDEDLQSGTAKEKLDYMCRELSDLQSSLAQAYYGDTGQKIGAPEATTPTSNYEALVRALKLAVTAPTDEKSKECLSMAEGFASKLSELEVERAKREAKRSLDD